MMSASVEWGKHLKDYLDSFYKFAFGAISAVIMIAMGVAVTDDRISLGIDSLSKADFATLVSGFGGAALGGVISWMLAREAGRETLARDAAQRQANEKAMALAVILKAQHIANGLTTLRNHFYKARRKANNSSMLLQPMWRTTKPVLSPTPSRLRFEPAEFAALLTAGRMDLVDRCNLLALRYEVDETVVKDYSRLRAELQEAMLPYSNLAGPGGLVETAVDPAMHSTFAIRGLQLEEIIRSLYASILEDANEAIDLCLALNEAFKKHFGEDVYPLKVEEVPPNERDG